MATLTVSGQDQTPVVTVGTENASFIAPSGNLQVAINNARSAILSSTGRGSIFLKAGSYTTSGPIDLGRGFVPLRGAGRNATIVTLANGANCDMVTTPDDGVQGQWLDISDIKFDGNAANQTSGHILNIRAMNESTISNCLFMRPKQDAIRFGQSTVGMFSTNPQISRCRITADETHTTGAGIALMSGSSDCQIDLVDIGYFKQGAGVILSGHNGGSMNHINAWQCKYGFQLYNSDRIRMVNLLSDYAEQHGFAFQLSDDLQLSCCQARESSMATNNTYDGFWIDSGNRILMCNIRAMGSRARYGIRVEADASNLSTLLTECSGNTTGASSVHASATGIAIT
jgi:hypothetical protein